LENNEIKKEKCERKKERAACYTEVKYVIERRSYETKKTNPGDAFSGVYGIWGNDSI
jgi:bisphosphoglycerate-dependent phosphoglycerate mutase